MVKIGSNAPDSVIDGHNDTILWHAAHALKFSEESQKGHMDLPRLQRSGFLAGMFALCPTKYKFLIDTFTGYWLRQVKKPENGLHHVKSVDDIEAARSAGKIGAIMQFEGAGGIDAEFTLLHKSYERGLRVLTITWKEANKFGTGAHFSDPQVDRGLTPKGRELVVEAQKLGITIDVSHLNEPSFWDVIDVAKRPVVATHSNARAICDHPRNLRDDQIEAIGEKGGVIGINFGIKFLDPGKDPDNRGLPLDVIKQHVDHIVSIAGVDTVALGADFDGVRVPDCVKDCTRYPALLEFFQTNGYSKSDVRKIASENWLRVFRGTWQP